jgi:threonine aldolase
MFLASDNTSGAHPAVLDAVLRANEGYPSSYGADPLMDEVRDRIRALFDAPEAAVYLVATGTACNALLLATLAPPWTTIFTTPESHIHEDECNAPEFFTGGAKLTLVASESARMTEAGLRAAIAKEEGRGVHGPQRGPVSLTQVTERGTVYSLADLAALGTAARDHGLPVHLDGARFANASVALDATPAAMARAAGAAAISFGGTKNGCLGVEAAVILDPAKAWEFELRRKRGGHLFSKHRYLSAQMAAYLRDDLWHGLATTANAAAARLARGLRQRPDVRLVHEPGANMIFAEWPRGLHRRLHQAGARYYIWNGTLDGPDDTPLIARLVTSWSTTEADVDRFLDTLRG